MKIVLFTHRYPLPEKPFLISDVQALHLFTQCWARDGHEVHVVVFYQHQNNNDKTPKPFFFCHKCTDILRDGVHIHLLETRFIRRLRLTSWLYLRRLGKMTKKWVGDADLTVAHFPSRMYNLLDTYHPGRDKAAIIHITDIKQFQRPHGEGKRLLAHTMADFAAVGFRSGALQRMYHALGGGGASEFLAMSGAPFREMPPAPRGDGPMRVVYVGTLIPRKQADRLTATMAKLTCDWRLTIVGEGQLRPAIEKLAEKEKLKDRVTLTGHVSREKALEYMRRGDVFVLQSYDETFGLVYLEAMAQRLICVGSRNEGVDGTIVDGENGFLVDAHSDDELLSTLEKIARMTEAEKEKIRSAAYDTARHMTEEGMAREYLRLAQEALSKDGTL